MFVSISMHGDTREMHFFKDTGANLCIICICLEHFNRLRFVYTSFQQLRRPCTIQMKLIYPLKLNSLPFSRHFTIEIYTNIKSTVLTVTGK